MTLTEWLRGNDTVTLALTLWGEARGEPIEGRIAVGSVVMNRARLQYRGATVSAVCLYPAQFSCWAPLGGSANYAHLVAIAEALQDGGRALSWTPQEAAIYNETLWVAEGLVAGRIRDRVVGALHYLSRELYETNPPRWAAGRPFCCAVGGHLFLKGIA